MKNLLILLFLFACAKEKPLNKILLSKKGEKICKLIGSEVKTMTYNKFERTSTVFCANDHYMRFTEDTIIGETK